MTRPRILLVEDNPDDAELTLRAFARTGIENEVVHIADGEEALDYLHGTGRYDGQPAPAPAVVLLDLNLPRVPGLRVLERLRADPRTQCLPVVILSSSNEHGDIRTSYELGANSFVRKPVDYAEFLEAARHLALYWLVLNQRPRND